MSNYEKYEHHSALVSVREDLKGKHKDHCLCYDCRYFTPEAAHENCPIAQSVYALCVEKCLVLPVWECPKFRPESKIKLE